MKAAETAQGEDIVLICDGVRPMITSELVSNCIREAGEYENAVPVTPSIDSVLESFDGQTCRKSYKRNNMFIRRHRRDIHSARFCGLTKRLKNVELRTRLLPQNYFWSWEKISIFSSENDRISR